MDFRMASFIAMDETPARPGQRPFRARSGRDLAMAFESAHAASDGAAGAHCVHECWMRGLSPRTSKRHWALTHCRVAAIA
jgi:hypothetical protein